MNLLHLLTVATTVTATAAVHTPIHPPHLIRRQQDDPPQIPSAQNYTVQVSWTDSSAGSFENRYWVDARSYTAGGPVILSPLGERNGQQALESRYDTGLARTVANATGGLVVYFEHRYYGASHPPLFNLSDAPPPRVLREYYRGLSAENALEDMNRFARRFEYGGQKMDAGAVPWVFVGGSYAGALAAWMRVRNPDVAYAALAESATVETLALDTDYFATQADYVRTHGWANCSADIGSFVARQNEWYTARDTAQFEEWMTAIGATADSPLRLMFRLRILNSARTDDPLELFRAASRAHHDRLFNSFQMFGPVASEWPTFCDALQAAATTKFADRASLIADHGVVASVGWDDAKKLIYATYKTMWDEVAAAAAAASLPDPTAPVCADTDSCEMFLTDAAWGYQRCFDLGSYMVVAQTPNAQALRPAFENANATLSDCVGVFGSDAAAGPSLSTETYGGRNISASNIFWLDGAWDPWLSHTPNSDSARTATASIPAANHVLPQQTFFGAVTGGFHTPAQACPAIVSLQGSYAIDVAAVRDLYEGGVLEPPCTEDVLRAQQLWLDALKSWLPRFEPHDVALQKITAGGSNATVAASQPAPSAVPEHAGVAGRTVVGSGVVVVAAAVAAVLAVWV